MTSVQVSATSLRVLLFKELLNIEWNTFCNI